MNNFKDVAFFVLVMVAMGVMWCLGYVLGRSLERKRYRAIMRSQIPNHYQAQTGPAEAQVSSAQFSGEKLAMDAKEAYRRREEVRTRTPDWKER